MKELDWRSSDERAFAEKRRWKLAHRDASLYEIAAGSRGSKRMEYASQQLGDMYDHATVYDYASTRRPVAIIVHPYGRFTSAQVNLIARQYGLRGQIIEPTMYPNPEAQTVVFWRIRRYRGNKHLGSTSTASP